MLLVAVGRPNRRVWSLRSALASCYLGSLCRPGRPVRAGPSSSRCDVTPHTRPVPTRLLSRNSVHCHDRAQVGIRTSTQCCRRARLRRLSAVPVVRHRHPFVHRPCPARRAVSGVPYCTSPNRCKRGRAPSHRVLRRIRDRPFLACVLRLRPCSRSPSGRGTVPLWSPPWLPDRPDLLLCRRRPCARP
jgi:hypothetical protein